MVYIEAELVFGSGEKWLGEGWENEEEEKMGKERNVHQDVLTSIVCGIQGVFILNMSSM